MKSRKIKNKFIPKDSSINKSRVDTNDYEYTILPSGLRVLAISNPKADKAGCALSVGVGSYDEPIEGLAHFLEHMLFMGTEEYPGENHYMDFLNKHNGASNAYTTNECTVYYFDVGLSHFEEALRIFSSFFKTPLFLKDSVEREVSAVHSEFLNGICNDDWRIFRMLQIASRKDTPESRFNVGNKDTLRIENIHQVVRDFWSKTYSPEKMCLVMYSNVDFKTYRKYLEMFDMSNQINLENLSLEEKKEEDVDFFDESCTARIIRVEPIKDQKTLIIHTLVPQEFKLIRKNPYVYISHIFSKEDEGGFVRVIKDSGWGFYADLEVDTYKRYSLLKISIGLTETGLDHLEGVLRLLVSYFSTFQYSQEEYWRLKDLKDLQFHYKEMDDPIECVESLSELLQFIPVENIFDYSYTLEEWDENLLKSIVGRIVDTSRWLIFLLSKDGDFDQMDPLYKIRYRIGEEVNF